MAEKDIAEKILLSYADVFLDCENVLMYGGRQKLKANEMQPAPTGRRGCIISFVIKVFITCRKVK